MAEAPTNCETASTVPAPPALTDVFGRKITYLRLSVTDRCDLRCRYCMTEHMQFMPRNELLSTSELMGIANAFIDRGVRTIRLTGGEPLTRRDIIPLAAALGGRIGNGLDALTLTTNGTRLAGCAADLRAAGIRRVNVSVDTLDAADFAHITRGGDIGRVLAGIDAALQAGLLVRINMVAMAGVNDRNLPTMLDWCASKGMDLALIESMPMGGGVDPIRGLTHIGVDAFIERATGGAVLTSVAHKTDGPARYVRIGDWPVRVGLITPISQNFCAGCNRIRMTAKGEVHGCLGHDDAIDLAAAWRSGGAEALDPLIARLMATKAERHLFQIGGTLAESGTMRHMNVTGG